MFLKKVQSTLGVRGLPPLTGWRAGGYVATLGAPRGSDPATSPTEILRTLAAPSNDPGLPVDLVTGATGLLGSHIAERLIARGRRVRALVRPGADTEFIASVGADLFVGDLTDPASCARAVEGISTVYHAAAKVGDWGRWVEFQAGCLDATATLARAAADAQVDRFLHISSTSAYGHPRDRDEPIDESEPPGQNLWVWDPYTRSKVECERIVREIADREGLAATVIRPSWLYGERDRTTVHRILGTLRAGRAALVGRGDNPLSAIYAGNVAEAAILAALDPGSVGEAYNVTNQGFISQADFMNLFAEAAGLPPVRRRIPYAVAFNAAFGLETAYRLSGSRTPPFITRYGTWLLGRRLAYSTAKAEARLGWRPSIGYRESIARSVRWYLDRER